MKEVLNSVRSWVGGQRKIIIGYTINLDYKIFTVNLREGFSRTTGERLYFYLIRILKFKESIKKGLFPVYILRF